MQENGYAPLGDDPAIKALVEAVRNDIAEALENCVAEIKRRR